MRKNDRSKSINSPNLPHFQNPSSGSWILDPECEIKTCNLRYHRICTYFRNYRRCKFGEYCSFKHEENNIGNIISDNQRTNDRLSEIEILLKEKDNLANILDTLNEKIADLDKYLERQDNKIEELDKTVFVF